MSRLLAAVARAALPALCLAASLVAAGPATASPTPIGPNQYFVGNVNGAFANAPIRVACFGAHTGHPMPDQFVYVTRPTVPSNDVGYTGAIAEAIVVSLRLPNSSSTTPLVVGRIATYETRLLIPTSLTLPCYGSGAAVFTPAPFTHNSKADSVSVVIEAHP